MVEGWTSGKCERGWLVDAAGEPLVNLLLGAAESVVSS